MGKGADDDAMRHEARLPTDRKGKPMKKVIATAVLFRSLLLILVLLAIGLLIWQRGAVW
jgi:hypothetical protein